MEENKPAFDIRLACLMEAVRENWVELEAEEVDGKLVVRLKEGVEAILRQETEKAVKKSDFSLDDPRI